MNTSELEGLLARWRETPGSVSAEGLHRLSTEMALAHRDAGNVPDREGRTLRLILVVGDDEVDQISTRRLEFEPDFHDAPEWRIGGSKPVNVVPLRTPSFRRNTVPLPGHSGLIRTGTSGAWWERPELRELEEEWRRHGTVGGLPVPGEHRSFVFKTVLELRSAGREVTVDTVAGSVARWLSPDQAAQLRSALEGAAKRREPD